MSEKEKSITEIKEFVKYRTGVIPEHINPLLKMVSHQQKLIDQQAKEIERLKYIAGLLAGEIDITNEVFDYLSAEDDYEFFSSKAKGTEGVSP